jgi:DNA-binding CsgD family transcriptional regulator
MELPPGAVGIATEVDRIATGHSGLAECAEELLGSLRRVTPFQAGWIGLSDRPRGNFVAAASHGYDATCLGFLASRQVFEEAELVGMALDRPGPPMAMRDALIPPEETRAWPEYLWPAGFREGVGVALFTPDGRRVGLLSLHTDDEAHPNDAALALLALLAPTIAAAVDPMRSISTLARVVGDATAGIVMSDTGDPLPLPGLPSHLLLVAGSPVLAVAASRLDGPTVVSFLCPYHDGRSTDQQVRITVLACPREGPGYLAAILLVSPVGDVHGLSPRELQVLGLLVEGWTNARIAADLFVAERTVAAHVEHILFKLAVPTRTTAAVLASRLGLYVPALLG